MIKVVKILKVLSCFILLLLLSSCWFAGDIDDSELNELDDQLKAAKRKTLLDSSLVEFGRMLQAYDVSITPIQSKNIGNQTAAKNMPTDIYTMVATTVNKIGKTIVFVPYDVQYIVGEETTGGHIQRLFPEAVISGGITGFDKDMIEKEREGDLEGGWSGASVSTRYSASGGVSRITLDLNMLDYKSQSYYPGVLATNAIIIRKDKLGWGLSASYMDFAVSFDSDVKTKQGVYAALRYLVELSVLELFGKYFNVPFWKCIKGASADTNMLLRLEDNFDSLDSDVQILYLKKFLFLHGYKDLDRTKDVLSVVEKSALDNAMRKHGVSTYSKLFIELWENVPMEQARSRINKESKRRKRELKFKREKARREALKQAKIEKRLEEVKRKKMLEQQKNAEKEYNLAIAEGDRCYKNRAYVRAERSYYAALQYKPNDPYASKLITKTRTITDQIRKNESMYKDAVSRGDKYFKMKDYSKAEKEYIKALNCKNEAKYPKTKLREIEKLLMSKNPLGVRDLSEDAWNEDGY